MICEAISTGLPVICSDVCDNSIYVNEGFNGFLFNPFRPNSIAEKLSEALDLNETQYQIYRKNSRNKAMNILSSSTFVHKYIDILRNC